MSHATVSMALRDIPKVKPATREYIRKLASEMGYQPNSAAVALKAGASRNITLVLPNNNDMQQSEKFRSCCNNDGYQVTTLELSVDIERQRKIFESLLQGNTDGVITYLYRFEPVADLIEKLLAQRKPMAIIGPPKDFVPQPGLYPIYIDNTSAVRKGIERLIALGHTRIAHTLNPDYVPESHPVIVDTLKSHDITDWDPVFYYPTQVNGNRFQEGYQAAKKLLKDKAGVTAIQCFNDRFAIGLIRGLHDLGVKVPGDISVIGSDNEPFSEYGLVSLSTIDMSGADSAKASWQFLHEFLNNPDWEKIPDPVYLKSKFIERESIGKVPEKRI